MRQSRKIRPVLAILTPVSSKEALAFLTDYAPTGDGPWALQAVVGIPTGTVNSSFALDLAAGGRIFLRVYEEQDRTGALAEAALLSHLAGRNVATPSPVPRKDGGLVGELAGKPAALFPWREGTSRCLARVSAADTRRVGRALAEVHLAGAGATLRAGRFRPEDLEARLARIARYPEPSLAALGPPLQSKLSDIVKRQDPSLPRGLAHGDLFSDNVLWGDDGEIRALLDFESACEGAFAFDLMVTILAWCFRDSFEPALTRAMVAGYQELRPLSDAEARGLHAEGCFAALRFTVTRITDNAIRSHELGVPPRRDKDWRRFAARHAALESMGEPGLRALLGL